MLMPASCTLCRLAREHSADVAVAFDVAQQLLPPTPANTPKEGDTKWGVLRTVLSLEPSAMTRLMGTTGARGFKACDL